eukprot:1701333-Amphidinium_carterae.2
MSGWSPETQVAQFGKTRAKNYPLAALAVESHNSSGFGGGGFVWQLRLAGAAGQLVSQRKR